MATCDACKEPKGIEGGPSLVLDPDSPRQHPRFICQRCGARFNREYVGSGTFVWTLITVDQRA